MRLLVVLITLFLASCTTTGQKNRNIVTGMSEGQVISIMGNPDGVKSDGEYEVLTYSNRLMSGWSWDRADYHVVLKNKVVDSFGTGTIRQSQTDTLFLIIP